ncbi:hypothetical protein BST61_g11452 [Cercospora zeina]
MSLLWSKLDRTNFEKNITSLVAHGKYQDQRLLADVDRPRRMQGIQIETALSEHDERQLADDIAFLTCVSQGRDGVAAAAVQHFPNKPFLRVTVSANGGIPEATDSALRRLFAHLQAWSRGESMREDTLWKIQTTIVTLHRERIFDRLGRRRKAETSECEIEKPIERILSQATSTHSHDEEQLGLHRRLKKFQQALQKIVASQAGNEEQNDLVRLLRCANKLMYFQDRISEHFGVDWMRQLHAIANYHRIFHSLLTLATRAKTLFGSTAISTISPPSLPRWKQKQKIVHAEIQILAHFEQFTSHRPRYIRASKRPCYLCYLFMHGHGMYNVPRSHGEVFKKWGIEDNYNLSKVSKKRMMAALQYTANEVASAVRRRSVVLPRPMYLQAHHTASKNVLGPDSGTATLISKATPALTALDDEGPENLTRSLVAALTDPPCPRNSVLTPNLNDSRDNMYCPVCVSKPPRSSKTERQEGNIDIGQRHDYGSKTSILSTPRSISRTSSSRSPHGTDLTLRSQFRICRASPARTAYLQMCGLELFVEVESDTTTRPQSHHIVLSVGTSQKNRPNVQNIPGINLDELSGGEITFKATTEEDALHFAISTGQQDYILQGHRL